MVYTCTPLKVREPPGNQTRVSYGADGRRVSRRPGPAYDYQLPQMITSGVLTNKPLRKRCVTGRHGSVLPRTMSSSPSFDVLHLEDPQKARLRKTIHVLWCTVLLLVATIVWLAMVMVTATNGARSLVNVYENTLSNAKYVDLTHAFAPDTPLWPGFGPSSFGPAVAGSTWPGFIKKNEEYEYEAQGFVATSYRLATDQLGTQLDAPAHWWDFGATVSDIPATVAVRPLVVINIAEKVKVTPGYSAQPDDVHAWEAVHGQISQGSVVMFRSDWSLKWEDYKTDGLPTVFPGVSLETLKLLHTDRGILFHGHEPLDTDMTDTLEGEAWLMHNNYMQAEGVTNLDKVPEYGALISIGFAKAEGGTGGLARFVAICPPESAYGDTIWSVPGAPLPLQSAPLQRDTRGVLVPVDGAAPAVYCSPNSNAMGCPLPE